jgi:hypothetical protein
MGLAMTVVTFHIDATTPSSGAASPYIESNRGKMDSGTIETPSLTKCANDVRMSACL